MTAFPSSTPDPSIEAPSIGWSELVPRYVLIEDAVRGRRVLEAGTLDPRPLARLSAAGAARVAATSPYPERHDRAALRGRRVELISMELGVLDFENHAFDVVLVPDLVAAVGSSPDFLSELRRVLAPEGVALIGFEATGRTLTDLLSGHGSIPPRADPVRLAESVRRVFPDARFFRQVPFVGVAFLSERSGPEVGLSLDTTLSGVASDPSHLIAIAGRIGSVAEERTLVELPFGALEAHAREIERGRVAERARLERALELARQEIERKNASLQAIGARLPPLRVALETQLSRRSAENGSSGETVELRQNLAHLETMRTKLEQKLEVLTHELERERGRRRDAETRSQALEQEVARVAEQALVADLAAPPLPEQAQAAASLLAELEEARAGERARDAELQQLSRLRERDLELIEELEARAAMATRIAAELDEAQARARNLERAEESARHRANELERMLEGSVRPREHSGDGVRRAEERAAQLERRLESQALERAQEVHLLLGRLSGAGDALVAAERDRDTLRARVGELERELAEAVQGSRALGAASERLAGERLNSVELRGDLDHARREAHQARAEADRLQRQLGDREIELEELREANLVLQSDRSALEITAVELNKSVETLRARIQELRTERDMLARTSQLLLSERDAAAGLARRALEAEQQARELAALVESRERTLGELERALEARDQRETELRARARGLEEDALRFASRLEEAQARTEVAEREAAQHRDRVQGLDQQLARLQQELGSGSEVWSNGQRRTQKLEEALREAGQDVRAATRELTAWRERVAQLDAAGSDALRQVAEAHAARARAEAEATEASGALAIANAAKMSLQAELKMTASRLMAAESAWKKAVAERKAVREQLKETEAAAQALLLALEDAKRERGELEARLVEARREKEQAAIGLGRTLEDAAELVGRVKKLETALAASDAERKRLGSELEARAGAAQEALRSAPSDEHLALQATLLQHEVERLRLLQARGLADRERLEVRVALAEAHADDLERRAAVPAVPAVGEERSEARLFSLEAQDRILALESDLAASQSHLARAEAQALAARVEGWALADAVHFAQLVTEEAQAGRALAERHGQELTGELTRVRAERAELEARLGAETTADRAEGDAARAALSSERERVQVLEQELEQKRAALAQAEDQRQVWARDLADRDRRLDQAQAQIEAERARLEQAEAAAQAAHDAEGALIQAQAALRELSGRIDAERQRADRYRAEREAAISRAGLDLTAARSEAGELRERLEALEAQAEEQQARATALEAATREAVDRVETLAAELESVSSARSQAETALAQARVRVEELESLVATERSRALEERGGDVRIWQTKAQEAEERALKAEAQITKLETSHGRVEARAQEAEARATKAEDAALRAERGLARAEGRAEEAEKRATSAEARAHQAEIKLEPTDAKIRTLEGRASEAEGRALNAERRAQQLEGEVKQLETRAAGQRPDAAELERAEARAVAATERAAETTRALEEARRRLAELEQKESARGTEAPPRMASNAVHIQLNAAREEIEILRDRLREATAQRAERPSSVPAGGGGVVASLRARCESLEAAVSFRDAELQRMRAIQERAAADLDEARAEVGRKLGELKGAQLGQEEVRRDLADSRLRIEQLKSALARQGEAAQLKQELQAREQENSRLSAQRSALEAEVRRLRGETQSSEQSQAKFELRIAELETALAEGNHRIEALKREVAEKAERLRRLAGLTEP